MSRPPGRIARGVPCSCALLVASLLPIARATGDATGDGPSVPRLRIETGMHTAPITSLSTDRAGRYLVTGSNDGTARVWSLAGGELLQTLRLPLALDGGADRVTAVALSPDGSRVAVAGRRLCIVDRATGQLIRPPIEYPAGNFADSEVKSQPIQRVVFLPDGGAVAMLKKNALVKVPLDPSARTVEATFDNLSWGGLDVDQVGRLAFGLKSAVQIRPRVEEGTQLVSNFMKDAPPRPAIAAVRFSPDGARLACGTRGSRVYVRDAKDPGWAAREGGALSTLYLPDTAGVDGSLEAVAWSAGGTRLHAAGSWRVSGRHPIRTWSEGGRGRFADLPVAAAPIVGLSGFSDGRLVYAAEDPAWGVLSASGERTVARTAPIARFSEASDELSVDETGATVRFRFAAGEAPVAFSLARRGFTDGAGLHAPRTAAPEGITVEGWRGGSAVTANSVPLDLEPGETSRCVAFAPDEISFALGTSRKLIYFSGGQQTKVATPAPVWAVNLSGDGRLAVVALGDGTLRWYRLPDGKELLALFPHGDRRRWIAFTPSGYYDASIGGEDLIGWEVGDGQRAADFFPASRFRDRFYRPDVIARLLATRDEAQAVAQADAATGRTEPSLPLARGLPAVVRIQWPQNEAAFTESIVRLSLVVQPPSGGSVKCIQVRVNGGAVPELKCVTPATNRPGEVGVPVTPVDVQVPLRDSTITVIAEGAGLESPTATVQLRYRGGAAAALALPRLFALSVGVTDYRDAHLPPIKVAHKDADAFAKLLRDQEGKRFRTVEIHTLLNEQATRKRLDEELRWLRAKATADDVTVLFVAGHGLDDPREGYYFMAHDSALASLARTALPAKEVRRVLAEVPGRVVVFLDTCHAGAVAPGGSRAAAGDVHRVVNELASDATGAVVFAAATGIQDALEPPGLDHGAFTQALLDGLAGKAAPVHPGRVTVADLESYVGRRVPELTGGRQTPASAKPAMTVDFALAEVR